MNSSNSPGAQRLSVEKLKVWERLEFGVVLSFGMSTFDEDELSLGDKPSMFYAPDHLDVDQWISVARDAGMTYAVLTAKHHSGHCLWPSRHTDYTVATSGNTTDVVEAFVRACEKRSVRPGLYYASWDNHNRFGSITPAYTPWKYAFTTAAYRDFQMAQIEELLTGYGPLCEVWIDIPDVLGPEGRRAQYEQINKLQPDALVLMNSGFGDGSALKLNCAWPTDLMSIERGLPSSAGGYNPWHTINLEGRLTPEPGGKSHFEPGSPKTFYIPGEVCDPIGKEWFALDRDVIRSDGELLGMRLICQARGVNLLLGVSPSRGGIIEPKYVNALQRLRNNCDRFCPRTL